MQSCLERGQKGRLRRKKREKNANIKQSKYPSKIPKPNVQPHPQVYVKTNGFALIIPNKKILITAKTKNGNQPMTIAKTFMKMIAKMFPSLDTRIKRNRNANGSTNGFPFKLKEKLPSESALINLHMNIPKKKSVK